MSVYELAYLHVMMMHHAVLRPLLLRGRGYLQPGQTALLRVQGAPLQSDGPLGAPGGGATGRLDARRRPVRGVRAGPLVSASVRVPVAAFVGQRPHPRAPDPQTPGPQTPRSPDPRPQPPAPRAP